MKKCVFLIVAFIFLITASAHEYILLASKFKVQKDDTLELHLFVADGFTIELERPLQKGITTKYELITAQKTDDLLTEGKETELPVLARKADFEGLGLIHMERGYASIALDNQKFLDYLKEDHIENISLSKRTERTILALYQMPGAKRRGSALKCMITAFYWSGALTDPPCSGL